jgi:hypothetical protein
VFSEAPEGGFDPPSLLFRAQPIAIAGDDAGPASPPGVFETVEVACWHRSSTEKAQAARYEYCRGRIHIYF